MAFAITEEQRTTPAVWCQQSLAAGFPSPAEPEQEARLSLDEYLVRHPLATFFVHVRGNSMSGAGILDGDVLVVDRSLTPVSGDVVVAVVDGAFTVKYLRRRGREVWLEAAHPDYPPLRVPAGEGLEVWGVVVGVVRRLRR